MKAVYLDRMVVAGSRNTIRFIEISAWQNKRVRPVLFFITLGV